MTTGVPARPGALLIAIWVVIAFLPALGAISIVPGGWYAGLNRPPGTPPDWIFGPVWIVLYLSIGLASALVAAMPAERRVRGWLLATVVQLLLNAAWTPLFFGWHRTDLSLVVIGLLLIAIITTIVLFWRTRPLAGQLLVPYALWVGYATYLNAGFVVLNRG